ncbi:alpha/beta fold hydrolase [Geodermatophilus sp. DSM 44513]|uniref:alpha/beta fold hydrolase n=1 Tax=Geodermatophilus sp. DSM 44513 TaxID=1528104 RepID=UPI0012888851|nr:alpha/beta hydrolase [Geodermatophilus sp. DSM 44513]WNV76625.1 alpha/beta hydrolase [Geodermatophilus sp. DSM 44513]
MIRASYVTVRGALAYVEQSGSGRPVLCLHTAGQSGVQWRRTTERLAALGHRVIVPDLPGHGRSEPAIGGPVRDLGDYAEWCLELLELLEVHEPFVVGCSIGGKIALDLGVRAGARLAGIVAMAADARNSRASVSSLRRELEDAAAPSRSDRTYFGTLAVVGRRMPAERAELVATMHRREDPVVSTSDLLGWATHDLRASVHRIPCPTHLVVGDDDLWLDVADVVWTAEQIPHGGMTVLQGIGHYPMEEIDDFAALLHGWLVELDAGRTATAGRGSTRAEE